MVSPSALFDTRARFLDHWCLAHSISFELRARLDRLCLALSGCGQPGGLRSCDVSIESQECSKAESA